MNDKTETQALVDLLGAITDRMVPGSLTAEAIAKASLQLHDQAEEIERLKAEIRSSYERGFDAGAARVIVSRPPDVAAACEKIERLKAKVAELTNDAEARAEKAYDDGWRTAANWMDRAELHDDIGSPAYIADRDVALGRSLLSVG